MSQTVDRNDSGQQMPISCENTVAVRLADMVPLLLHAARTERNWLRDFQDDIAQIPQDLYEILVAYQSMIVNRAA